MALTKVDDRGLKTPIELLDDEEIRLGNSDDCKIYQDSTTNHTFIEQTSSVNALIIKANHPRLKSYTGNETMLAADSNGSVELYHNNNKKLETTSTGALLGDHTVASVGTLTKGVLDLGGQYTTSAATPKLLLYNDTSAHLGLGVSSNQLNVNLSSGTFDFCVYNQSVERFRVHGDGAGVDVPDNSALRLGDSQDLKLYHNGVQSFIDNSTGRLKIRSNTVKISNLAEDHTYILSNEANAHEVQLYYDNSKKLETTSYGAKATGALRINTDSANSGGDASDFVIKTPSGRWGGMTIRNSDTNNYGATIYFANNATSGTDSYNGYITYNHGNDTLNLGVQSTNKFRLGASALDLHNDNYKLTLGTSQDAEMYFDSSNTVIKHTPASSGELQLRTRIFKVHSTDNTEVIIKGEQNGAVRLYHNGSEKLQTTSTGATVTGTLTATAFSGAGIIPAGGIIIWSGASNAIPTGWLLCDGSNSTPDLRGRFVVGHHPSNGDYDVGDTGGAESVTLTTAQIPSHNHSIQIRTGIDDNNFSFNQGFSSDRNDSGGTFNSNNTGGGQSHENRPPYYALCYIMKS